MVCVDGLQRFTAIKRFINNEIQVYGSYYKEFEDSVRVSLNMKININCLQTKKEVLEWYLQINEGGTPHTKSEIDKVKNLLKGEVD